MVLICNQSYSIELMPVSIELMPVSIEVMPVSIEVMPVSIENDYCSNCVHRSY